MTKDNTPLSEDKKLIEWLETNPDYEDMVRRAKDKTTGEGNWYSIKRFSEKLWMALHGLIFANARDFDGEESAPDTIKKDSDITAGVVSGATLINAITNYPILLYAFQNLSISNLALLTPGMITAVAPFIINVILLYWTNRSGTAASDIKHGEKKWFFGIGAFFFFLISLVQSVVAGVGSELINNRSELSYDLAQEKIEEQSALSSSERHSQYENYITARDACIKNRQLLITKPENSPERRSIFRDTYGTYQQYRDGEDWSRYKLEEVPWCPKADILKEEVEKNEKAWNEKLKTRSEIGNDLQFLDQEAEDIYQRYFDEEGNIRAGSQEVRLAFENFFGKVEELDLDGLGFSLFFFFISLITSFGAVTLTMAHAYRKSAISITEPEVNEVITVWLQYIWELSLANKDSDYEKTLIGMYVAKYHQSQRCDYPFLKVIARLSQNGKSIFPPSPYQLEATLQKLDKYLTDIYKSVNEIENEVFDIHSNTNQSQTVRVPVLFKESEGILKANLDILTQALVHLLEMKDNNDLKELKLDSENNEGLNSEKRIQQIWQRLNKEAHYLKQKSANSSNNPDPTPKPESIYELLDELPGLCSSLKAEIQHKVQEKIKTEIEKTTTSNESQNT